MTHRMYIPKLMDAVTLAADWTFTLHSEHRNTSLWQLLNLGSLPDRGGPLWRRGAVSVGGYRGDISDAAFKQLRQDMEQQGLSLVEDQMVTRFGSKGYRLVACVTLPKGTVLRIDRIYIRKGNEDFDSVTFVVEKSVLTKDANKKPRFWAKLDDVNTMLVADEVKEVKPPKPEKPRTTYAVHYVAYHSWPDGFNRDFPSIYHQQRESVRSDTAFIERMQKEHGSNLVRVNKCRDRGTVNWGLPEVLFENNNREAEVKREQAALERARRKFFADERRRIYERYGDQIEPLSKQGFNLLGFRELSLEQFESDFVRAGVVYAGTVPYALWNNFKMRKASVMNYDPNLDGPSSHTPRQTRHNRSSHERHAWQRDQGRQHGGLAYAGR